MRAVLLAAEGMAEAQAIDWIREATVTEYESFRVEKGLSVDKFNEMKVDGTGRPYWLVMILEHAPDDAKRKAENHLRVRSLLW